eukprot:14648451-Alexandrium_andersonii.AAC.1
MAARAAKAAKTHDTRALYSLVKTLAGRKSSPPAMLRAEDGTCVASTTEAAFRWLRHFAGVHGGEIQGAIECMESHRPRIIHPVQGVASDPACDLPSFST